MVDGKVTYRTKDSIAVVEINNPPMNTLAEDVRDDIARVFDELDEKKDEIKVVILTGAGEKAFIAGADIRVFADITRESARLRLKSWRLRQLRIENFERPVICAINGFCLGGGLELAMCCDIRIAASHAKLGQPEINLGIIPGSGGTQRLSRLVGEGIAKEMIYTGRFLDAEEAKAIGLVNKVVPMEDLMDEAMKTAGILAQKPVLALRAAKEAVHRGFSMPVEQGLRLESDLWCSLTGTDDQREGAAAFLEKRKPVFTGK